MNCHTLSSAARRAGAVLALASTSLLAACDGSNAWTGLPTGGASATNDVAAPQVEIVLPKTGGRVAVGDSVRVHVRVTDDAGVDTVTLTGYSLRGSAELGTQQRVPRFLPKVVVLGGSRNPVRDTTILRDLLPTADSLAESPVFLEATVRDRAGNVRSHTVQISIGGPRVQVHSPTGPIQVREGSELRVRVSAADSVNRIQSLTVRLNGAAPAERTLQLDPALVRVDTVIAVRLPAGRTGIDSLRVVVRTMANDTSVTPPSLVTVVAAERDAVPPSVRFRVASSGRAEADDSVSVVVVATDSSRMQRIGVSVRPVFRFSDRTVTGTDRVYEQLDADSATFRVPLAGLNATQPEDTSYVLRLEVTAFAFDASSNCAAATVANTPLSQACVPPNAAPGTPVFAATAGARTDITVVRGTTAAAPGSDRLVDLVADSIHRRVLVSNYTRGRVEILPFGEAAFSAAPIVDVGSRPWGLALGRGRDTLYVANSGGTNISVVPLTAGRPAESRRITTPDIRLYSFTYDVPTDSAASVEDQDFSDRPQYLGQMSTGQLVYSTVPTSTREPGTIRIYDPARDRSRGMNRATEIFVAYASRTRGRGVVVNAISAGLTTGGRIGVCPRPLDSTAPDPECIVRRPTSLAAALDSLRAARVTDTRIELGLDISSVALTDTTFVAVSRDNSTVAFGEGGIDPGRVLLFRASGGQLLGSTTETRDLVGNAAERVVGLGLNGDGSLGVARGRGSSYFFERDLRLQGEVPNGGTVGGSALHPTNAAYPVDDTRRRGFVSGVDASGSPYVDVVDSYYFRVLRRLRVRDRVIGPLIAVPVAAGDPEAETLAVRLFGITSTGIVQLGLTAADLR